MCVVMVLKYNNNWRKKVVLEQVLIPDVINEITLVNNESVLER